MVGFASGCHKCGGFPGSKTKDRSFLSECGECGTFTCNHHLTIMGHCPNCKSGKMKKVLTQRDVKKKAAGGMPGAIKGKGGKKESGSMGSSAGRGGSAGGSGGGAPSGSGSFKRAGSEAPRSSGGQSGLNYAPGAAAPDSVRQTTMSVLSEVEQSAAKAPGSDSAKTSVPGVADFQPTELSADEINTTEAPSHIKIGQPTVSDDDRDRPDTSGKKASADEVDLDYFTAEDDLPNVTINETAGATSDEEDTDTVEGDDIDPLDALFDDDKEEEAVIAHEPEHQVEDEDDEDDEDLTDLVLARENMTPEEVALIEEELAAASARRKERLSNLDTVQRLQKIAELPMKKIDPMSDYVDAFWGLASVSAEKDIKHYEEMVLKLRDEFNKDERLPRFLMGMVSFEPQEDNILNKSVINTIKSMDEVYCVIGFGPRTVRYVNPEKLELQLKSIISSTDQVLGIGLVGLDMHYAPYTLEQQKTILDIQLKVAKELNLLAYISSEKADDELALFLSAYDKSQLPQLVYTGMIQSDIMLQLVDSYDMHLCLRPELTHEANREALERTARINPVRWLPCSGMPHSAPVMHSGQWNQIRFVPDTINKFFAVAFGRREPEEFMALVVSNWARLLFSEPLEKEHSGKEDIWADYDPTQKLF